MKSGCRRRPALCSSGPETPPSPGVAWWQAEQPRSLPKDICAIRSFGFSPLAPPGGTRSGAVFAISASAAFSASALVRTGCFASLAGSSTSRGAPGLAAFMKKAPPGRMVSGFCSQSTSQSRLNLEPA